MTKHRIREVDFPKPGKPGVRPPWTHADRLYLRQHRADGAVLIAHALGRTPKAVANEASRMGISLRRSPREGLCPSCGAHDITPGTDAASHGVCLVCWERMKADQMRERAEELAQRKRYDAAKKAVRDLRRGGRNG